MTEHLSAARQSPHESLDSYSLAFLSGVLESCQVELADELTIDINCNVDVLMDSVSTLCRHNSVLIIIVSTLKNCRDL
jgi:hypothetical protein